MAKAKRSRPSLPSPSHPQTTAAKGIVTPSPSASGPWVNERWVLLGILLVTALAYWPTLRAGFIWDDDSFLTQNPLIQARDGLYRFWLTKEPTDYWPVTSTTLWFEWHLWGMNAFGYHAVNLALHLVEGVLLWQILKKLALPGALLAVAFFLLHPVNVESVAWITQRKNLMAMLFYLLSILWFLNTREAPNAPAGSTSPRFGLWYWLSLGAFTLAMLAKGSVALLPMVLVGVIAWQRPLRWSDALRFAPFFVVAFALAVVNVLFQNHDSDEIIRVVTLTQRLLGAGAVIWFYLWKAIVPYPLIFVYPQWQINVHDVFWWIPLTAAIIVSLALWWFRRGPLRPLFFAWAYFCISLVPVLGLTDIYFMKYSLVADHYQHLALIGICVLAGATVGRFASLGLPATRALAFAAAAFIVVTFSIRTWAQSRLYHDSETLFRATLADNPDCWMAHNNLGKLLAEKGERDEAVQNYHRAIALKPDSAEAHNNLALELSATGQSAEAIGEFEAALRVHPNSPEVQVNLAAALFAQRRVDDARAHLEEALRLRPKYAKAHNDLGNIDDAMGRKNEAIEHYQKAIALEPDSLPAHVNLANVLFHLDRLDEAIEHYQQALRLNPSYEPAYKRLGLALAEKGRLPEAMDALKKSVQLAPNDPEAHNFLGMVAANTHQTELAIAQFEEAVKLRPDYEQAQENLMRLQMQLGRE